MDKNKKLSDDDTDMINGGGFLADVSEEVFKSTAALSSLVGLDKVSEKTVDFFYQLFRKK